MPARAAFRVQAAQNGQICFRRFTESSVLPWFVVIQKEFVENLSKRGLSFPAGCA
jgi:hypothetical protein